MTTALNVNKKQKNDRIIYTNIHKNTQNTQRWYITMVWIYKYDIKIFYILYKLSFLSCLMARIQLNKENVNILGHSIRSREWAL